MAPKRERHVEEGQQGPDPSSSRRQPAPLFTHQPLRPSTTTQASSSTSSAPPPINDPTSAIPADIPSTSGPSRGPSTTHPPIDPSTPRLSGGSAMVSPPAIISPPASRLPSVPLAPNGILPPALRHSSFNNAEQLVQSTFFDPLVHLADDLKYFPGTRAPDAHTIAVAYSTCNTAQYPSFNIQHSGGEEYPFLTINSTATAFNPTENLGFKQDVTIDADHFPQLFYSSQNYCQQLLDGRFLIRSTSENCQQGSMASGEGDIISFLLKTENGLPVFFEELPIWLKDMYWMHENKSNFLSREDLKALVSDAAGKRKALLEGLSRDYKDDPIFLKFSPKPNPKKVREMLPPALPDSGSIPDHIVGRYGDEEKGVALFFVEEKRTKPGAIRDLIYYLAKYQSFTAFLGCENTDPIQRKRKPKGVLSQGNIWVGSPDLGGWYGKLFWQVYAEGHAHKSDYFAISDRSFTVFGKRAVGGHLTILHFFCHLDKVDIKLISDTLITPLETHWSTKKKVPGLVRPISPVEQPHHTEGDERLRGIRRDMVSHMGLVESLLRMAHFSATHRT